MLGRLLRLKKILLEAVRGSLQRPKRKSTPSVPGSRLEDRMLLSGQGMQKPLSHDTSPLIVSGGHASPEAMHPGPVQAAPSVTAERVSADAPQGEEPTRLQSSRACTSSTWAATLRRPSWVPPSGRCSGTAARPLSRAISTSSSRGYAIESASRHT